MSVVATAPGKLVLLGEYAVLEGATSLVAAVDRRARVLVVSGGRGLVVVAPDIGVKRAVADLDGDRVVWQDDVDHAAGMRLSVFDACVRCVVRRLGTMGPMTLTIETSEFIAGDIKLGIGSSAAVATAVTGALLAAGGVDVTSADFRRVVFEVSLEAHALAQGGLGSGIDVAASTFGGVLEFVRGEIPESSGRKIPIGLELICVWSGFAAVTSTMVGEVKRFAALEPDIYRDLLDSLTRVAKNGCEACATGDVPALMAAVTQYADGLRQLGLAVGVDIVSESHQYIGEVVCAHGGVYKPSGAGGGDLGVAFAESGVAEQIRAALRAEGFVVLPMQFGTNGVEVTCHE